MMSTRTQAQQRAIDANPDLPADIAAAFADDLNEMADASGVPKFTKMLGIKDHADMDAEGFPPAAPGSIQEMCPHLRDPRFV